MTRVSDDVLVVLSQVEFPTTDQVRIPAHLGQLERSLYQRVDKVLQAFGGSWTRHVGAHVFAGSDARLLVEHVLTSGDVVTDRDLGNFATPVTLAREVVDLADVQSGLSVLEPSAGTGRLVEVALAAGGVVTAVEREAGRRAELYRRAARERRRGRTLIVADVDDFLCFPRPDRGFDRAVMNPPFCRSGLGDHLEHVQRAHDLLVVGGILVAILPISIRFRADRRHASFRDWLAERADEDTDRGVVRELPGGTFRESGTDARACVIRTRRVDG